MIKKKYKKHGSGNLTQVGIEGEEDNRVLEDVRDHLSEGSFRPSRKYAVHWLLQQFDKDLIKCV